MGPDLFKHFIDFLIGLLNLLLFQDIVVFVRYLHFFHHRMELLLSPVLHTGLQLCVRKHMHFVELRVSVFIKVSVILLLVT